MRLYLTAKTSITDLFIDYIQVKLKSGEEVSLNWDYSDIERTSSGFSARYKGVYFDEEYANGRIEELRNMKITVVGVYYESKQKPDITIEVLNSLSSIATPSFYSTSGTTDESSKLTSFGLRRERLAS